MGFGNRKTAQRVTYSSWFEGCGRISMGIKLLLIIYVKLRKVPIGDGPKNGCCNVRRHLKQKSVPKVSMIFN